MRVIRGLLLSIILISGITISGVGLLLPWSARSAASNNSGYLSEGSGKLFSYPGLASQGVGFTSTYLYNMEDLPRYIFNAGGIRRNISFGYAIEHLHHPDYQETNQLLNIGYGTDRLRIGVNIRNLLLNIRGEPLESAIAWDVGLSWEQSSFSSALSWLNVSRSEINEDELPVYMIWEINYLIVKGGEMSIRLEKEDGFEFQPTLAGGYEISDSFTILSSYSLQPETLGCGFEIQIGRMGISYGLQYHEELLETHYLTIYYAKSD